MHRVTRRQFDDLAAMRDQHRPRTDQQRAGAGFRELDGDGLADAGAAAGDDRGLSCEGER